MEKVWFEQRWWAQLYAVLLLGICLTGGCGTGLAEVSGTVLRNGQPLPLEGAQIIFMNREKGVFMTAKLKPGGEYRVSMAEGYGLPPGQYQVSIAFPENYRPFSGDDSRATADAMDRAKDKIIPKKYWDVNSSGLVLDLTPAGAKFDVELK